MIPFIRDKLFYSRKSVCYNQKQQRTDYIRIKGIKMANLLKKWIRRARRSRKPRRRKRRKVRWLAVLIFLAAVGLVFFLYGRNRTYTSYKVLATSTREENESTKYIEADGNIFKYSRCGSG